MSVYPAAVAALAGSALSLDAFLGDEGAGIWQRFPAGDAAVWTVLLVIGLLLGGKRLLWLVLAAPFAFLLRVAFFVVAALVALAVWP